MAAHDAPARPSVVPDGYLTTEEVARIYRTSESTVRYWRQQKKRNVGPRYFKAGRRVLYDSADVLEHLRQLREQSS